MGEKKRANKWSWDTKVRNHKPSDAYKGYVKSYIWASASMAEPVVSSPLNQKSTSNSPLRAQTLSFEAVCEFKAFCPSNKQMVLIVLE